MDLVELKAGNVNRHPWEYSRADSMLKILSKFPQNGQYGDIGGGDAYFAHRLSKDTSKPVYVIDTAYTNEELGPDGNLIRLKNISELAPESLDTVILMDVLEHINNVDGFLTELLQKVKPGGKLLITVPAHQFLFSQHDVFLLHFRRYSGKLLKDTLLKQNLEIESLFSFYTSLFMARCLIYLAELISKPDKAEGIGAWGFPEKHFMTRLLTSVLNIDFTVNYFLGKLHLSLPGLSLCAVCRKKS